jgi:hypothetical protein
MYYPEYYSIYNNKIYVEGELMQVKSARAEGDE